MKAKIFVGSITGIIVIAALGVNLVPNDKANDKFFADYCAEMTRSLMKSPSSYKLDEYNVKELPLTRDELAQVVQMAPFNNIDDAINNDKLERTKIEVFESYSAKNAIGVELVGSATCVINKTSYGSAGSLYSTKRLSIDGEEVDELNLLSAELTANKKAGKLKDKSSYMKKLDYLLNI